MLKLTSFLYLRRRYSICIPILKGLAGGLHSQHIGHHLPQNEGEASADGYHYSSLHKPLLDFGRVPEDVSNRRIPATRMPLRDPDTASQLLLALNNGHLGFLLVLLRANHHENYIPASKRALALLAGR